MKTRKLLALVLTLCLLLPNAAMAVSWEDYTDVSGHWAEADLQKAFSDGLLTGTDAHSLAPDKPVTAAQLFTVLCRLLGATKKGDISNLPVPADAWYADAVAKAAALGLLPDGVTNFDTPLTRQDALGTLASAFCITPGAADLSALSAYSDAGKLKDANKNAVAALVSRGFVKGYAGALNVNGSITRAEFVTVIYRIAGTFTDAASLQPGTDAAVLKGSGELSNIAADRLFFDCTTAEVSLKNAKVGELALRSEAFKSFAMDAASAVGTLSVAVGGSTFSLPAGASVKTLRLVSCADMSLGAEVENIELTGYNMHVIVSGQHGTVAVSGSGNTVELAQNAALGALYVSGTNNAVKGQPSAEGRSIACGEIHISGTGNTVNTILTSSAAAKLDVSGAGCHLDLTLPGSASLAVDGTKNSVILYGVVSSLTLGGTQNTAELRSDAAAPDCLVSGANCTLTLASPGAGSVKATGAGSTIIKTKAGAVPSVALSGEGDLFEEQTESSVKTISMSGAKGHLKLAGTAETITVDGNDCTLEGKGKTASLILNGLDSNVTLATDKTDDSGAVKAAAAKKAAEEAAKKAAEEAAKKAAEEAAKKAAEDLARQKDADRVLALVTTGYKGNYTRAWAENHDYTPWEKKTWVDAKGYGSSTGWLIWVNTATQHVNIFQGSKGDWYLCYTCVVGTGASSTSTPVGVYKTTYKSAAGWTTSTYTVRPVVGFNQGTGYAFHSRLYYPGSQKIKDASIGYPISHGCVRMYDEDVNYIYNNVPTGTTVVVY